jgi:MtrB/PioB family decaheme-associated outer membrane protein
MLSTIVKNRLLSSLTTALIASFTSQVIADGFRLQDANLKNVNKAKWQCKYCPATTYSLKKLTLSLANNSEDNGHFATLVGQQDKDLKTVVNGYIDVSKQDKHYRFLANGLGRENNQFSLIMATPQSYRLAINHRNLNTYGDNDALTPFKNTGKSSLELSDNWQRISTTTDIDTDSLQLFSNKLERQYWQLKAEKQWTTDWLTYVNFQHEDKKGVDTVSGNILTKAVLLPRGIDQKHLQLDMGSYYSFDKTMLLINYYHSNFNNNQNETRWQSPYSILFGGANSGQLSTAPNNQMSQLSAFGRFQYNNVNLQARFSYGQLTQDQAFLPYSINSTILVNVLPKTSLDGNIKTFSAHVNAQYKVNKNWRLSVNYHFDDRDNKTQIASYQHVLTDSVLFTDNFNNKTNKSYRNTKEQIKLESKWRFLPKSQLIFGGQFEQRERDIPGRSFTEDKKVYIKLATQLKHVQKISLQLSQQLRDVRQFYQLNVIQDVGGKINRPQYYFADRKRMEARAQLSFYPIYNTDISLLGYFSRDHYLNTDRGLRENKRRGIDLSAHKEIAKDISFSAYVHKEWQYHVSRESYRLSDWFAVNEDKTNTAGLSVTVSNLADDKLTVGAGYNYYYAKGIAGIEGFSQSLNGQYNELIVNSQDVHVFADYSYTKAVKLHFNILYQFFNEDDWRSQHDVNEVINVLSNGLLDHNYDAYHMVMGVTYQF